MVTGNISILTAPCKEKIPTTERVRGGGGQANPVFFLQKSFHSFGDGSSREAGHYVRVTDEGVTADARGRPWGPWGGTCPTPGQNNGDFIPWHALSAYSRDTAPRFWR